MNEEIYNRHYITTREDGVITATWSDGPQPDRDTTYAVCINERGGYQFRMFPDGEENPAIYDTDGIPLYKWDGERVLRRTEEEINVERTALLNSPERRASEIKRQLTELDSRAIRPLRAILAGTPSDEDRDKLRDIEERVVALRKELAELGGDDISG